MLSSEGTIAECPNCRIFPSEKSIQEGDVHKMNGEEILIDITCPGCENDLRLVYSYTGSESSAE